MSAKRQRMTWAALDREAAAAPALPGYGVEDQDHPAHTQDDPEAPDYMIGGPSEFAEDVHPGPYGDSGRPALPGVGVEDQDHPAHQGQVGRQANLMNLVRHKAAKALKLAKATLGKQANWAAIEDQAFNFMSMDDSALDASLGRLSGGFLAEEEEPEMVADFGMEAEEADPVMARLKAMEEEIASLRSAGRRADQNDPVGKTLGTSGKSEDEEKKEEVAVSNKSARAKLARLFTACDLDNDGFVTEDDWMGPPEVFASLDTDRDGILAKHEVMAGEIPPQFLENIKKKKDEADDKDDKADDKADDKDEKDEKAEKKAALAKLIRQAKKLSEEIEEDDAKEGGKKAGKKAEDDEEPTDEKVESKKGGKKSEVEEKVESKKSGKKAAEDDAEDDEKEGAKKAFGHLADFDDDELEMLSAMNYGFDEGETAFDEGEVACGDVMASKKAEDEEPAAEDEGSEDEGSEDSDKEASFFATGFDPMGLADGTNLTAADKAAFEEVFGKQGAEGEEPDGDEGAEPDGDEKAEKEANKRLASLLKPQPRKPSQGVQRVGTQARTASGRNEVAELSSLWASDPDVSGSFT